MDLATALGIRDQRRTGVPWETAVALSGPSGGFVQVNSRGATELAACPLSITPTAGNVVAILRGGPAPLILQILSLGNPSDIGPAAPDDGLTQGVSYFPALYSWTWDAQTDDPLDDPAGSGTAKRFRWDSDLSQGSTWAGDLPYRRGYWYHQWTVSAALGGQGVIVDAARIRLPRSVNGPDSASVTLVWRDLFGLWPPELGDTGPYGDVPQEPADAGAAVPYASAPIGVGGAAWFDLSASLSWVQDMVNALNPNWPNCIGICGTDVNLTLQGVHSDPMSGCLEITWHK